MKQNEAPRPPLKQPTPEERKEWRDENIKLLLSDRSTPITSTRKVVTWIIN